MGSDGISVIVFLVSLAFSIFVLAVLVRVWSVLGDVRLVCRLFKEGNPSMQTVAIEMCEDGKNVYVIARKLKVSPQVVRDWCLEPLRKRAIMAFKDGKKAFSIASTLGVQTNEVEQWIDESND